MYRGRHWFGNNMLTFHSLDVNDCWHKLRFKKQHLWRLSVALRLPRELRLDNGSYTNNEEVLVIFWRDYLLHQVVVGLNWNAIIKSSIRECQ